MDAVMDVPEAAEKLRVSHARVRRLCATGALPAQRKGGRWLIPAAAVAERAEDGGRRPGRPPAARTVWNLLAVLDGRTATLSSRQRARALHLLDRLDDPRRAPGEWRRLLAPRAGEHRVRVHPGVLARLAADERVRPGGVAAAQVGLAGAGDAHAYVRASDLDAVLGAYRAVPDPEGQVVLHVVTDELADGDAVDVGRAAAAADLLGDSDPRAVSAGASVLAELRSHLPSA